MRKLAAITLLFLSCSSPQPVTQPVQPTPPVTTPPVVHGPAADPDTVWMPGKVVVKDSVIIVNKLDTLFIPLHWDTGKAVYLSPVPGDNYPQLQAAINYCLSHGLGNLYLAPSLFPISHTLIIADTMGGTFHGVTLRIHGAGWAKNSTAGYNTVIVPMFANAPAIIAQQCKGCIFENLEGAGPYSFPNTLTQLQIDTLSYAQWSDGICTNGHTDDEAFIAFDVFGDSTLFNSTYRMYPTLHAWYLPTGGSGSTACKVRGCYMHNFSAGVTVGCGPNYNGEEIDVDDNQFVACRTPYAYGQAQTKANTFNNNMIWGGCRIIVDGTHHGFQHGDGSTAPFIDGMNIAGINYELIEATTTSFPVSIRNVYGEGLFKIGITGSQLDRGDGAHFEDCQIDFQNGGPLPDFWYHGGGTLFQGGHLRYYNGAQAPSRIIINDVGDKISDLSMSGPPVVAFYEGETPETIIDNVGLFYPLNAAQTINTNTYDSIAGGSLALLRVDRSTFTGYFLPSDTSFAPGMLLLTQGYDQPDTMCLYAYPPPGPMNYQLPLGIVTGKNGDTVRLSNIWVGAKDSTVYSIYKALYKAH